MPDVINISLRECRLVGYRVLWHAGAPQGTIPAIVDTVVAAEAAGLHGLTVLRDEADALGTTAGRSVGHTTRSTTVDIDAHGKHALATAPDIIDLAGAIAHRHGTAEVRVRGVARPDSLAVLEHVAADHEMRVTSGDPAGDRLCFTFRHALYDVGTVPGLRSARAALRGGIDVDADLWWALFHRGIQALTPDSPVSRRHTGRSVFDANGHIVGELGEDLDGDGTEDAAPITTTR